MKYCRNYKEGNSANELCIVHTKNFYDFDFDKELVNGQYVSGKGSTNYLPVTVSIKNLQLKRYTYEYVSPSEIIETEVPIGQDYIYLYNASLDGFYEDISKFQDDGGRTNLNRLIGTEYIYIENCNVNIRIPQTLQFKNTVVEYGPAPSAKKDD
jgi:hypothetical protein